MYLLSTFNHEELVMAIITVFPLVYGALATMRWLTGHRKALRFAFAGCIAQHAPALPEWYGPVPLRTRPIIPPCS